MVVKRRNKTTLVSCSRKFSMESIVVGRVCTYLLSAKAGVLKLRYKIARGSGIIKPSLITFGLGTGAKLTMLDGHTYEVTSVAFSTDGMRIVSGSLDKSVRVWDASTGAELTRLNGHTKYVTSVAFSTDGMRIVSGSWDESVRVWAVLTGAELTRLSSCTDPVTSNAFSTDGTRIVSDFDDESLRECMTVRIGQNPFAFADHAIPP